MQISSICFCSERGSGTASTAVGACTGHGIYAGSGVRVRVAVWDSMIGVGVDLSRQERSHASLELGEIAIVRGVLVLVSSSL